MKILPINNNYNICNFSVYRNNKTEQPINIAAKNYSTSQIAFYPPVNISFGLAESKQLRTLMKYKLPCMYTGVDVIEPKILKNFMKKNLFNQSIANIIRELTPYENSLLGQEKEIYGLIKFQAKHFPNAKVKDIINNIVPLYKRQLEKEQEPIFKTLIAYSFSLPEKQKNEFDEFMAKTYCKLRGIPIYERFSYKDYMYKFSKIAYDIKESSSKSTQNVFNKLIKLNNTLEPETNKQNIKKQRKIINKMLDTMVDTTLYEHDALRDLLENSLARLNSQKVLIPFTRKAFIYDLDQILKATNDNYLKDVFINIAKKLPTSKNNIYAYITKLSGESSEKIMQRLIWPSTGSIEHINPRSRGGKNKMKNYGVCCSVINSNRGNTPFPEQIEKVNDIAKYCQKYVDRLIELAHQGIFAKERINVKYIEEFKNTIAIESEGAIILDTSKLYEGGKFNKEEILASISYSI